MSNKNTQKSKDIKRKIKEDHKAYVNNKIDEIFENPVEKHYSFNQSKRLKLYDYIIILISVLISIGISFLISIYGFKDISKTEWFTAAFTFLSLFSAIITGWLKNNYVARFFNDKRRRYQTTLSSEEGFMRRIIKILLLISLILLIISVIFVFTL
ncbi:hypothetical protein [Spiroplasma turonicum]|uniref:Transmembrane protein n=1 Tax=Spiroplasma turonicum TaxID=216946 RepID=A0A0K1P5T2_9MOLU|nr:hypothetical protein [Spiroplasma turonicum]AKU79686.1 hypothetical protein STURON_00440 [Spiroplasma turonicum]ALX70706.1 hypothetical protein STURO_v1c04380 [Spiroplasma turonicum]